MTALAPTPTPEEIARLRTALEQILALLGQAGTDLQWIMVRGIDHIARTALDMPLVSPPPRTEELVSAALREGRRVSALQPVRDLIARWVEPCHGDCQHAHCPLLHELRAVVGLSGFRKSPPRTTKEPAKHKYVESSASPFCNVCNHPESDSCHLPRTEEEPARGVTRTPLTGGGGNGESGMERGRAGEGRGEEQGRKGCDRSGDAVVPSLRTAVDHGDDALLLDRGAAHPDVPILQGSAVAPAPSQPQKATHRFQPGRWRNEHERECADCGYLAPAHSEQP